MKIIYTGLESSGKSLLLAKKSIELLARNKRWHKKYGFNRKILSNLKFSTEFEKKGIGFIEYWEDVKDVIGRTGVDIIHDEISSDFSALKKEPLNRRINRWLRQGAKQGVHYYATAQEFHDVHLDWRRRAYKCYEVNKIIGSNRGGNNLPPVNHIWGICSVKEVDIRPYNELVREYKFTLPVFNWFWIGEELCKIFDTRQVISASKEPELEHIERICQTCNYKKTTHL